MKNDSDIDKLKLIPFWVCFLLTFLLLEAWSAYHPIAKAEESYLALYRYQREKMKKLPAGSVVLLGDSSLGNGVHAKTLSEKLGHPVVSLALTGFESFSGYHAIIEKLVELDKKPSLVVVIESPTSYDDALTTRFNVWLKKAEGTQQEEASPTTNYAARLFETLNLVKQSPNYRGHYYSIGRGARLFRDTDAARAAAVVNEGLKRLDYLPQARIFDPDTFIPPAEFLVHSSQREWLEKLHQLCLKNHIPLYLAAGPTFDKVLSERYRAGYSKFLDEQPIPTLYNSLPGYSKEYIGDTEAHVSPEGKIRFTEFLAKELRSLVPPKKTK